jgi:hypothetical protein
MTIVDRPVRLVEEAGTVQKVAEARTFEAVSAPLDLGRGTAPGFPLENWPVTLGEFPVEAGKRMTIIDEMVAGQRIDEAAVSAFVEDAVIVVAHNAGNPRPRTTDAAEHQ